MAVVHEALWPQCHQAVVHELAVWVRFRLYLLSKRCLDVAVALIGLLVLWPVLLVVAVKIMLDSPGPPIFTQERVGARWCGRGLRGYWKTTLFHCYKFRTMFHHCDQSRHQTFVEAFAKGEIEASDEVGLPYKLKDDPRVTRFGRWLRKVSLDELPQLFNIVKGEMSLVGPRPVPIYEARHYQPWHRERLQALPGLTGLWQVKGRSRVTFDEMARLDIEYVRNQSILLDLRLLLATIPAALLGKGAG
jgi:lipopolysaccharide/colanic/teichoic acid biosynthesis glycosyltransferase